MKLFYYLMVVLLLCCSCSKKTTSDKAQTVTQEHIKAKKVLVFTKTLGWRHKSIETGVKTIQNFGNAHNFIVTHTEDSLHFTTEGLPQYDVIVFLNTTDNILDAQGQAAFEKYIQSGGSFLGVHSAADTEYDWPWYGRLVGGYFDSHPNNPNIRKAQLIKNGEHTSTNHLENTTEIADEWYNYKNLNSQVKPVLILDESSYEGGTNGDFHPISWYHKYDGGKAFYTGLGHPKEAYFNPLFRKHLEEALLWCLE